MNSPGNFLRSAALLVLFCGTGATLAATAEGPDGEGRGTSGRISAAVAAPVDVVQPAVSERGLLLLAKPGWARLRQGRRSRPVAVGAGDHLTQLVELGHGWAAAGVTRDEAGSSVFAVRGAGKSIERLPTLGRSAAVQLRPVLLEAAGELVGAAWLEGPTPRSMAVRYRPWNGLDWGPTETVAGPGPGSQTALAGVAPASRGPLLVWSRFDGQDDEIFWSRRSQSNQSVSQSGWSRPARVAPDNATPDVTPALTRVGSRVVLAWSRFQEGRFQVVTSALDGDSWQSARAVSRSGGLFPTLVTQGASARLLYRSPVPRGWGLVEWRERDNQLAPARRGLVLARNASNREGTPAVVASRRGRTSLVWAATRAGKNPAAGSKRAGRVRLSRRTVAWRPAE